MGMTSSVESFSIPRLTLCFRDVRSGSKEMHGVLNGNGALRMERNGRAWLLIPLIDRSVPLSLKRRGRSVLGH